MLYRFADCALYTQLYTLERAGQRTRLAPKVFEVLCYLIAHRDRVVSKQELCDQVWEGLAISDATLESCLRTVRISVGDSGQAHRIIQNSHQAGLTTVTELLRSEAALAAARTRHLAAVYDHRIAAAALEHATGTLTPDSELLN